MMYLKKFFLLLIISFVFGLSQSLAQNYIDIDLNPPKKSPPKKVTPKSSPTPKPQPATKPVINSAPKKLVKKPIPHSPNKPATPISSVKPVPVKSASKAAPTARVKTNPIAPKPAINMAPANKTIVQPSPKPIAKPANKPAVSLTPTLRVAEPIVELTPVPAPSPATISEQKNKTRRAAPTEEQPRFKNRHAFAVDYTTWYETMKLKNKATNTLVDGSSHYFGLGFNYDFTVYREKYGFAFNLGAVTGNAQAGTKDSGDYYERRIVWTGFRGGGRLFYRANNRVDLGLGFVAQTKSTKWPDEENYSVSSQSNPQYFYYLDTRWRLNYKYELVQGFGTHLRSYALAWMLGINYTLN